MRDWRVRLGIAIGLAAAVAICTAGGLWSRRPAGPVSPTHGPLLSDCDDVLREVVIHYVPEAAEIVERPYREFLRQLPPDVTVYAVCPDRAAFDDLASRVGCVPPRLVPVLTGHAMTCWARDRWLALEPARPGAPHTLLAPHEEEGAPVWPARRGDQQVPFDLADGLAQQVTARRSDLAFDGGDFVADSRTVFVTPAVAHANVGSRVASARALAEELRRVFLRRVVLLPQAPPHHAGMFMMPVGGRTVLVGDPSLVPADTPALALLREPDLSEATRELFDAVAQRCREAGYRVVRIPVLPDRDGRTYLTYVNAILDDRDGRRVVYMPVYEGAAELNAMAASVWRSVDFEVQAVDCTSAYRHYGSLRCLVNVLQRTPSDA